MLPLVAVQEGCVVLTVGAVGAPGAALIMAVVDATQPAAFFTVTVYAPAERLVNCPEVFEKLVPSIL